MQKSQNALTLHLNTPRNPPPLLPPKILTLPNLALLIREPLYVRDDVSFEQLGRDGVWGSGVDGVGDGNHGGGFGTGEDAETGHVVVLDLYVCLCVMRCVWVRWVAGRVLGVVAG